MRTTVHRRALRIVPVLWLVVVFTAVPAFAERDAATGHPRDAEARATPTASSPTSPRSASPTAVSRPGTDDSSAGQVAPPPAVDGRRAPSRDDLLSALAELQKAREAKAAEMAEVRRERDEAGYPSAVERAEARLDLLHEEAAELDRRFTRLLTGADASLFQKEAEEKFDPQQRFIELLEPILDELAKATADSRAIANLEDSLALQQQRQQEARSAVESIRAVIEDSSGPVREQLDRELRTWSRRLDEATAQVAGIGYELDGLREKQQPLFGQASDFVRRFLRTRGLNLLLAVLAAVTVFLSLGGLRTLLERLGRRRLQRHFADRMVDLGLRAATTLAAIGAMLFVFNATGDWFLLGLALAFLIASGWVAVKALPQFSRQIWLVLNLGAVREGECVVFDSIPWKVESLGFTVVLVNDRLGGGVQQVPVRLLVDSHSRPLGPGEELFPCAVGDWVRLDDGVAGRVEWQTRNSVGLVPLGGGLKVYPTPSFLALAPQNLSRGYRVVMTFGIDYRHQSEATREIAAVFEQRVRDAVAALLAPGELVGCSVRFRAAAASSLDYVVRIDVAGSAAGRHVDVECAASAGLVDACTERGWVIPFQQVTLHRADT